MHRQMSILFVHAPPHDVGNSARHAGNAIWLQNLVYNQKIDLSKSTFSGNSGGANSTVCIQVGSLAKGSPILRGVEGLTPTEAPLPIDATCTSGYLAQVPV